MWSSGTQGLRDPAFALSPLPSLHTPSSLSSLHTAHLTHLTVLVQQEGDGQSVRGDVVKRRMYLSSSKVSGQGDGKSSAFASSPAMSQSHFIFLVR